MHAGLPCISVVTLGSQAVFLDLLSGREVRQGLSGQWLQPHCRREGNEPLLIEPTRPYISSNGCDYTHCAFC